MKSGSPAAECPRCATCGCEQDRHLVRLGEPVRERGILVRRPDRSHRGECTGPGGSAICPEQCREFVSPTCPACVACPRCGHGMVWHPSPARDPAVPAGVVVMTAGIDVQGDRLEATMEAPTPAPGAYLTQVGSDRPPACAGNCKVCDVIEKILDVDTWILRR